MRRWVLSLLPWLNFLLQTAHSKGFSPVWVRRWAWRWHPWLNFLLQTAHSKGFSPVWVRRCTARADSDLQVLLHTVHVRAISLAELTIHSKCWRSVDKNKTIYRFALTDTEDDEPWGTYVCCDAELEPLSRFQVSVPAAVPNLESNRDITLEGGNQNNEFL